ncbi:MAG TPA: ABC transporter permease [Candidatus Nanopelagicales bacterium]|nr:ABC transporter permease [Candidatus Nanopelagicales bacterium]
MATTTPSVLGSPVPIPRPFYGWAVHDGIVTTRRFLIQTWRVPELIFYGLVQPIIFLVLFAFVFGGAIGLGPGGADASLYREFLVPGVLVQNLAFAVMGPTVGIAADAGTGIMDRFRSLPMAPSAVLSGRTVAELVRSFATLLVVMVVGLAIGWRIHNGFWSWLAAVALMMAFGYALTWVGCWVGLGMPNEQVASTAGLIWLFPITFISSAFVPVTSMPTWLQPFAQWNPVSTLSHACRELFGNPTGIIGTSFPEQHAVLVTVLWSVLLLVVFVPLSVRKYRRSQVR